MAEKLFYSMGEVAEMFDVKPSLIRFWGKQFDALKPKRNKKGNRMFTPEDVETMKLIYHLVKERGMTLDGARRTLKTRRHADESTPREVELLDRLQRLKAMLLEVREQLGGEEGVTIVDSDYASEEPAAEQISEPIAEPIPEQISEQISEPAAEPIAEPAEPVQETAKPKSGRGRKSAKTDEGKPEPKETAEKPVEQPVPQPAPAKEERTLPFYEQTLF